MNKKFIRENYNIDKIITAQELVKLSKSYKDNEEEIIVSMTRKHKNPQQPPEWFAQWSKNVFETKIKAIEKNQTKDRKLLQKDHKLLHRVIKLNNLKC